MSYKKPDYCPEWFDINRYERCLPQYSRQGLSMLIWMRQSQYQSLLDGEHLHPDRVRYFDENWLIHHGTHVIEKGINARYNNTPHEETDWEDIIYDLTVGDAFQHYNDLYLKNDKYRRYFNFLDEALKEEVASSNFSNDGVFDWDTSGFLEQNFDNSNLDMQERLDYRNMLLVGINLSWSDAFILEGVKRKLSEVRARTNSSGKRYSDADIQKILDNKVIPYIDLHLWQMLKGIKFTYPQLADLLFPPSVDNAGIDRVNAVRRVTHKKAMELLESRITLLL